MEEDCSTDTNSKKRARDNSNELDSETRELKRGYTNACTDDEPLQSKQVDRENESNSPEYPEWETNSAGSTGGEMGFPQTPNLNIPEDFFDILDDAEAMPAIQDLDSVIRSFEEEILQSSPSAQATIIGATTDSGNSQPELGYLLEASDDELGLPPTVVTSSETTHMQPENHVEIACFDNKGLKSYDSFDFGLGEGAAVSQNNVGDKDGKFGASLDGLFEHLESGDFSDFAWQPESLPAL